MKIHSIGCRGVYYSPGRKAWVLQLYKPNGDALDFATVLKRQSEAIAWLHAIPYDPRKLAADVINGETHIDDAVEHCLVHNINSMVFAKMLFDEDLKQRTAGF